MSSLSLSPNLLVAPAPSPPRRGWSWRGARAVIGAWTVYGLVHATFWFATAEMSFRDSRWIILAALILAWSWALLTPVIFRLTRAVMPSRVGWPWSLLVHGITVIIVALAMTRLRVELIHRFTGADMGSFWPWAVFWLDVNLFTYLTVVLTGWALQSHRRYLDRALRAHVLETQLARAQLHYLELQLQPHFLFNSLNAIQELAHESPDAAELMLRRLHALLAMSLARSGHDEVSLQDELSALEPYIDIQRTRFEWLSVSIDADAQARGALVPHLILQPLVENAIRHGLAVRRGPGHVDVKADRRGDRLLLSVRDNGVGLQPFAIGARPGIGLRNAGERMRQLYGADHAFSLSEAEGGGVVVEIDIPYRPAASVSRAPSWTDLVRSRQTIPEVALDEMASWRTGEFKTAMPGPNEDAPADPPDAGAWSRFESSPARADAATAEPAPAGAPAEAGGEPAGAPIMTLNNWLALVGLWLGAAMLWTGQTHLYYWMTDPTLRSFDPLILKQQVAGAMYWMALSVGVFYLARKFRVKRHRLVPHLAIHLGAAVVASFGFLYVLDALNIGTAPALYYLNINPLSGNFFVYFGLLAWSHSRDFVARYRAREITAAQLTSAIARSRFQALCMQVRPQFLLGTLDLLARLVHVDVPRADRLIARVADVLRLTLELAGEQVATLQDELELLAVTVEAHRLGVRPAVTLETDVAPAALTTPMPSRLLCSMVDELLLAEPHEAATPLVIEVRAERASDATRVRLHGETTWKTRSAGDLHAWWRTKNAAEAAVADAGPLVTVAFPDRATAVLIIADERPAALATAAA